MTRTTDLRLVRSNTEQSPEAHRPAPTIQRDIVTRWGGDAAILRKGFVPVPIVFLQEGASLKPFSLTPAEIVFVISLMAHKWDVRAPFPGYKKLASWMGVSESYVRKIARALEKKHFLLRRARIGTTNEFDLTPLFEAFAPKE